MTSKGMKIGVIGAGAWGTALAQVAAQGEREVVLWAREPEVVAAINESHENPLFLAGVPLSPAIRATGSLDDLAGLGAFLVVVPAQHVRALLADRRVRGPPLGLFSKGVVAKTWSWDERRGGK